MPNREEWQSKLTSVSFSEFSKYLKDITSGDNLLRGDTELANELRSAQHKFRRPLLEDPTRVAGTYRHAAVAVLFYEDPGVQEIRLLLMQRTPKDTDPHSGQISFPGGALEPGDNHSLSACAIREVQEELGISPRQIQLYFALPEFHIDASRYIVTPYIGVVDPISSIIPNSNEVHKVLSFPIQYIANPKRKKEGTFMLPNGKSFVGDYYDLGYGRVWGATAFIIYQVSQILRTILR